MPTSWARPGGKPLAPVGNVSERPRLSECVSDCELRAAEWRLSGDLSSSEMVIIASISGRESLRGKAADRGCGRGTDSVHLLCMLKEYSGIFQPVNVLAVTHRGSLGGTFAPVV